MHSYTGNRTAGPVGEFGAEVETSPVVGTWMWAADGAGYLLDEGAAEILTGDPDLAGVAIPLDVATRHVLPEDRGSLVAAMLRANREPGLLVAEFRVQLPDGLRWLLGHGRLYPESPGLPARGHGVLIDITRQKARRTCPEAEEPADEPALERAARHALAAREAIDAEGGGSLRLLIDLVLLEIGRLLARRIGRARAKALN